MRWKAYYLWLIIYLRSLFREDKHHTIKYWVRKERLHPSVINWLYSVNHRHGPRRSFYRRRYSVHKTKTTNTSQRQRYKQPDNGFTVWLIARNIVIPVYTLIIVIHFFTLSSSHWCRRVDNEECSGCMIPLVSN